MLEGEVLARQRREWSPVSVESRLLAPLVLHAERIYHISRIVRALGESLGGSIVFGEPRYTKSATRPQSGRSPFKGVRLKNTYPPYNQFLLNDTGEP